jgi:hypothetical protein
VIRSRNGSQALAPRARAGSTGPDKAAESVDTPLEMAGFARPGSVDTPPAVAGFDPGSVDTPLVVAGFGGHVRGRPPLPRIATPAALR